MLFPRLMKPMKSHGLLESRHSEQTRTLTITLPNWRISLILMLAEVDMVTLYLLIFLRHTTILGGSPFSKPEVEGCMGRYVIAFRKTRDSGFALATFAPRLEFKRMKFRSDLP